MKRKTKLISMLCGLCLSAGVYAQTTWYFGANAGLKFTGGVPTATAGSAMNTGEGCTGLVDGANNVMLYTDGVSIWNGNGIVQVAASPLKGNSSSTQTALVVPIPSATIPAGPTTKAFIFTVAEAETAYGNNDNANRAGLRVTLVSITGTAPATVVSIINSATDYNIRLTPGTNLMGEKLTVTPDGAGGYWVLTHGTGCFTKIETDPGSVAFGGADQYRFYAYHINCSITTVAQLDATEVSTEFLGMAPTQSWNHPNQNDFTLDGDAELNAQGQMKVVKTGATTARIAHTLSYYYNSGWVVKPWAQVFDFNLTNGIVSNPLQFSLNFNGAGDTKDGTAYGVEFSPNGRYLYVSSALATGKLGSICSKIYQYDLNSWTASTIMASRYKVAELPLSNQPGFCALQIAPNNKIYAARGNQTFIDVINSPNNAGVACGYGSGISVAPAMCRTGLPNTILVANANSTPAVSGPNTFCQGSPITVTGSYTGQTPSASYWEIYTSDASGNPINCAGAIVGTTSACYDFFQWYPDVPGVFTFPGSSSLQCGKYYTIKLAITNGCGSWNSITKTIYLQCLPTPVITSSSPNPICYGSAIDLCVNYSPGSGIVIDWSNTTYNYPYPGDNVSCIHTAPSNGLVYTAIVSQNGCPATATYTVFTQDNNPNFSLSGNLPSTTSPYYNITATPLGATTAGTGYTWEIGEIDASGAYVPNTYVNNGSCWWTSPTVCTFYDYDYSLAGGYHNAPSQNNFQTTYPCATGSAPGKFRSGSKYKITRGTWTANCPTQYASATIMMCGNCRSANGNAFTIEYSEVTGAQLERSTTANSLVPEMNIYPNPSEGLFTLVLPEDTESDVFVYDSMGKIVYQSLKQKSSSLSIDITGQPKGMYLVKVTNGTSIQTKKLLHQ